MSKAETIQVYSTAMNICNKKLKFISHTQLMKNLFEDLETKLSFHGLKIKKNLETRVSKSFAYISSIGNISRYILSN